MLSASKWFSQVLQCKSSSRISSFEHQVFSICRNRGAKGQKVWRFDKQVAFKRRRYYEQISFISSILPGFSWTWPFLYTLHNFIGNYRSVATQAFPSEDKFADELNQLLSTVESSPSSTRDICTTYIEKLCTAGNTTIAARLLQSLREKHIFLGANAYNRLLAAAGEANDVSFLSQVFKDLLVSKEPISSASYFNLAKAFKNTKDAILLFGFIKEVSELTFPRSTIVINRIIYAFAECGEIDKALLIFDQLQNLKCKPDLVTYNTVLGILGRVGRADEMLHEFASMKEANIMPDIISYNTLLNSLRKLGRLDISLVVLEEMKERGLEPDLRTCTALIESFGRAGKIDESLRLFNEMKSKHIRPSIYVYRSLISNLKRMGKSELAMALLREMNTCLSDLVGPKDFSRKDR